MYVVTVNGEAVYVTEDKEDAEGFVLSLISMENEEFFDCKPVDENSYECKGKFITVAEVMDYPEDEDIYNWEIDDLV